MCPNKPGVPVAATPAPAHKPKSLLLSKLVWMLLLPTLLLLTRYLSQYMPADIAALVVEYMTDAALVLLLPVLAGYGITLKASDNRKAMAAVQKAAKAAPVLLLVLAAGLGMTACGSAWPQTCQQTLTGIDCRCTHATVTKGSLPGKPWPAGRVTVDCDGARLPLVIDGDEVK